MRRILPLAFLIAAALGEAAAAQPDAAPAWDVPASIAGLQTQLRGLGYDPGPINGVMTAKTQRALSAYQRNTGPQNVAAAGDPVRAAQAALRQLGFLSGPADGTIGPQTRDAIIRFQAAEHLPIDPRVSDRLLADLERASAAAAAAPAPASASAAPASPAAPAAETPAASAEAPAALGRQPLPPGVTPPPIR